MVDRLGLVRMGLFAIACVVPLVACNGDEGVPTGPGTSTPTNTGGEDAGSTDAAAGKKKAAEQGCKEDAECETGVCFVDNQSFCTIRCTQEDGPTVCVAPFTGSCNKKGFCKRN